MRKHLLLLSLILVVAIQFTFGQSEGDYYFSKTVKGTVEEVTAKLKTELKKQGFGVITEIDMDKKLKEKLDGVDLSSYKILGVCSPGFAWQTLQAEENIGLFLPCKALVKDKGNGNTEVVIVNPSVLMVMLGKKELAEIADKVKEKFLIALNNLK